MYEVIASNLISSATHSPRLPFGGLVRLVPMLTSCPENFASIFRYTSALMVSVQRKALP